MFLPISFVSPIFASFLHYSCFGQENSWFSFSSPISLLHILTGASVVSLALLSNRFFIAFSLFACRILLYFRIFSLLLNIRSSLFFGLQVCRPVGIHLCQIFLILFINFSSSEGISWLDLASIFFTGCLLSFFFYSPALCVASYN